MEQKKKIKIEITSQCPECHGTHLIRDELHGELVCDNCGLVVEEKFIEQTPEYRVFTPEQKATRTRIGPTMTYKEHDKGLLTEISPSNRDAYGTRITSSTKSQLYRLRKWQKRIRIDGSSERNLAIALAHLNRVTADLNLPDYATESAALMYRKAIKKRFIRGRSKALVISAVVYATCKQWNLPRTLKEIASSLNVSKKEVGQTYRKLCKVLKTPFKLVAPQIYLNRFCQGLDLSFSTQRRAKEILDVMTLTQNICGKAPLCVVGASIYIATVENGNFVMNDKKEKITQHMIAKEVGVTEVSIRNRAIDICKTMHIHDDWSLLKKIKRGEK